MRSNYSNIFIYLVLFIEKLSNVNYYGSSFDLKDGGFIHMKKLLIALAVTTLGISSAYAGGPTKGGHDGRPDPKAPKTLEEKKAAEEAAKQAGNVGHSRLTSDGEGKMIRLVGTTSSLSPGEGQEAAAKNLPAALKKAEVTDAEIALLDSKRDTAVGQAIIGVIAQLAAKNDVVPVLIFFKKEVVVNLDPSKGPDGSKEWAQPALDKLTETFTTFNDLLKAGYRGGAKEGLEQSLEKAGFEKSRIKDILCTCFKIC
jgi:hypothetical protein